MEELLELKKLLVGGNVNEALLLVDSATIINHAMQLILME